MAKKFKFKVGDRVRCTSQIRQGDIGVIRAVDPYDEPFDYVVEFTTYKKIDYLDFDKYGCKAGYWCCKDDYNLEPATDFKIGDRVKAIAACDNDKNFIDRYGTVKEINNNKSSRLTIYVDFDDYVLWWCERESLVLVESGTTEAVEVNAVWEVKISDVVAVPTGYNYVARDMDGELFAYVDEPVVDIGRRQWYGKQFKKIDNNLFRELTWACAPIKVSRK